MKKHLLLGLALLASGALLAQDFDDDIWFQSGNLYYHALSPSTVEVGAQSSLSGAVEVPDHVCYLGVSFAVTEVMDDGFANANITSITLPSTLERIGNGGFYGCTRLTALHLPAAVREVEPYALSTPSLATLTVAEENPYLCAFGGALYSRDTTRLLSALIPTSGAFEVPAPVRSIRQSAFRYCNSITSVTLPEGLEEIGLFAFGSCTALTSIALPASLRRLGTSPFSNCTSLATLTLSPDNPYYVQEGYMILTATRDTIVSCHRGHDTVILPSTVTAVGGFSGNPDLRHIVFHEEVNSVLENAFDGCNLTHVTLPRQMRLIDEYAFAYNALLSTVDLPLSLDTMGNGAFSDCVQLTSVRIPDRLRVLPRDAFARCERLSAIEWGDALEAIGDQALFYTAFTSLTLPPTLRRIGVASLAGYPGWRKLKEVTFTTEMELIDNGAFLYQNLRRLRLLNPTPWDDIQGPLYGATVDTIAIPCGTRELFLADSYWRQFASKLHEDCEDIEGEGSGQDQGLTVYPNPAHDYITVETRFIASQHPQKLQLIDMQGRVVLEQILNSQLSILNLQGLPRGLYLLRTPTETRKIVVR